MSFLTPWFLAASAGILIPIAIHMIRRKKAIKVAFSTLRFLRTTSKKMVYFQQVRQWLLLLIRTLIFLLLAIAFARPFLGAFSQINGLSPQSAVILLDTSMSMRYGDHFARAKSEVAGILRSLQAGDEAALVTFSENTGKLKGLTGDLEELRTFLSGLDNSDYRRTRYLPALTLADQILQSARYPDRIVYLVSDFQKQAFDRLDGAWQLSPGIILKSIKIGKESTLNLAVSDVKSPNLLEPHGKEFPILARIRSLGSQHVTQAKVSLMMERANGDLQKVETQTVDLVHQSEAVVEFHTKIDRRSDSEGPTMQRFAQRGAVVVEDDHLRSDDIFRFTMHLPSPIRILAVNGESDRDWYDDESHWFRLALGESTDHRAGVTENESTSPEIQPDEPSYFLLDLVEPHQLDPQSLNFYHVVVLLNVGQLAQEKLESIHSYVSRGGNLLIALGDQVEAKGFNRSFSKITPVVLEEKRILDVDYRVITDIDFRHPLFQSLQRNVDIDFGSARFKGYWSGTAKEGSEILMRFDNGAPALVEENFGNGRVLLLTSSFDTEWSNLPLQAWYLPWLHEALRYLSRLEEKKRAYVVDEPVPVHLPPRTLIRVVSPLDQRTELIAQPQSAESGERQFYSKTGTPGFYQIRSNYFQDFFAVNTDPEESDLTTIDPLALRNLVVKAESETQTLKETQISFHNLQEEKSQRIWWWLLLFVVLLAIGETLLANRTFR